MTKPIIFRCIYELLNSNKELSDIVKLVENNVWWKDDFGMAKEATNNQKELIFKDLLRHQNYKHAMPHEQDLAMAELEQWGEPGTEDRTLSRAGWPKEVLDIKNFVLLSGSSTKLHESSKTSLQKMVLGMAIAKYGYEVDKKNQCTGKGANSIEADLQKVGIKITNETIKKHLEDATENDLVYSKPNK